MTRQLPISVFIITRDEEDRLPLALKACMPWAKEVIVVDSGSQDNTTNIAQEMGAHVHHRDWEGYGPQKVFAESLCSQEWVLNIDADEELSPQLQEEIASEFANGNPAYDAYKLRIKDVRRFAKKPGLFSPEHNRVRLYRTGCAGFKSSTVHDSVEIRDPSAKIGQLHGIVYHRTFRSYAHAVEKINRYTTMQAQDMVARGRKVSALRLVTEPFVSFLKGYFIKKHCFLGIDGVFEAVLYAFGRTLRLAKARELWHEKRRQKKEKQ